MATPIGNLQDITLRALETLKAVDVIAAEDTRVSRKLLDHFGIQAKVVAAHEHNERDSAAKLVALLESGKSIALVTDAGTPAISDPGALVVAQVREAGFRVVPIPGASAVLAGLAAAGMLGTSFSFHGFLPARNAERNKVLAALQPRTGLQVFFEAPHRIAECLDSMAATLGGARRVCIARELTKLFEQVHVCRLDEAAGWIAADENHRRGEFVLIVEGGEPVPAPDDGELRRLLDILMGELPLKQAVGLAAQIAGQKKNAVYDLALRIRGEGNGPDEAT